MMALHPDLCYHYDIMGIQFCARCNRQTSYSPKKREKNQREKTRRRIQYLAKSARDEVKLHPFVEVPRNIVLTTAF